MDLSSGNETKPVLKIRPWTAADLNRVEEISGEAFADPWSRESMEKELVSDTAHYLVAELQLVEFGANEGNTYAHLTEDGVYRSEIAAAASTIIIGYAGYWQVLDEGHVMNVAVDSRYRGRGIAKELVKAMLESGDPLGIVYWTLEVRRGNEAAIHVYEKAGFTCAGIRPGYYTHPTEDACIYWLTRNI